MEGVEDGDLGEGEGGGYEEGGEEDAGFEGEVGEEGEGVECPFSFGVGSGGGVDIMIVGDGVLAGV